MDGNKKNPHHLLSMCRFLCEAADTRGRSFFRRIRRGSCTSHARHIALEDLLHRVLFAIIQL